LSILALAIPFSVMSDRSLRVDRLNSVRAARRGLTNAEAAQKPNPSQQQPDETKVNDAGEVLMPCSPLASLTLVLPAASTNPAQLATAVGGTLQRNAGGEFSVIKDREVFARITPYVDAASDVQTYNARKRKALREEIANQLLKRRRTNTAISSSVAAEPAAGATAAAGNETSEQREKDLREYLNELQAAREGKSSAVDVDAPDTTSITTVGTIESVTGVEPPQFTPIFCHKEVGAHVDHTSTKAYTAYASEASVWANSSSHFKPKVLQRFLKAISSFTSWARELEASGSSGLMPSATATPKFLQISVAGTLMELLKISAMSILAPRAIYRPPHAQAEFPSEIRHLYGTYGGRFVAQGWEFAEFFAKTVIRRLKDHLPMRRSMDEERTPYFCFLDLVRDTTEQPIWCPPAPEVLKACMVAHAQDLKENQKLIDHLHKMHKSRFGSRTEDEGESKSPAQRKRNRASRSKKAKEEAKRRKKAAEDAAKASG